MDISFAEFVYIESLKDPKNRAGNLPRLHRDIAEWLESTEGDAHRLLMAYRHSGKSWLITLYVVWRLLVDPTQTFVLVSATEKIAKRNAQRIRKIIETNPLTEHLVPKDQRAAEWQRTQFSVVRPNADALHASVQIASVTGAKTGLHGDMVICDDIETRDNVRTEDARELIREAVEELDAVGDRQLYVGTPHIEDTIYSTLENDRSFNVLKKPVWRDEAHTAPQCPEMHSVEWIEEKQRKNRAGHFKSQYLLIPARSVEAQFSFDRINITNDALIESDWETRGSIRGQRSVFYIGDEEVVDIRAYWDPASGLKNRDDSIIAVVAKTTDDSVHVVHVEALPPAEGNDYDAQCHVVLDVCRKHFVNEVLVETNFNPILESQLKKYAKERRGRRLRVRGVRRTTATRKVDFIADTLDALMRTGLLCVNEQVLGTDFKNQLESFPFGRHDDILDAIAGAVDELIPTRVRGEGTRPLVDNPLRRNPRVGVAVPSLVA